MNNISGVFPTDTNIPRASIWDDLTYQRSFLDKLAKPLNVVDKEGWYRVSMKSLIQIGASDLLSKYNDSPFKLFSSVYPEYPDLSPHAFIVFHIQMGSLEICADRQAVGYGLLGQYFKSTFISG